MGILDPSSPLYGASGRVGDLVLYQVDGKTYFRRHPRKVGKTASEKRILQQKRMVGAQTLFLSVKKCILYEALNAAAREQHVRSGYHLFLKRNIRAFGENDVIDYSLLSLSEGSRQFPHHFHLEEGQGKQVLLSWEMQPELSTRQENDRLKVAAVFPDEPYRIVILPGVDALRKDKQASFLLPVEGSGQAHLYCFFADEAGKTFSPDRYLCVDY
ncbi:MAG: hypothetical protein NC410_10180 [Oscillibacter sp.]|nr:hypothetical protein [Oscillibacter sp.]